MNLFMWTLTMFVIFVLAMVAQNDFERLCMRMDRAERVVTNLIQHGMTKP